MMRHMTLGAVLTLAGLLGYGCGGGDSSSSTVGGVGGSGGATDGGGGTISLDGAAGSAGIGGTGGTPGSGCGGKPCANHTGSKAFNEPGTPGNASSLFGSGASQPTGTEPTKEPAVVYPNHETMFPINVSRIHHEWSAGTGNDLFQLEFVGPKTTVTVYTSTPNWQPTEEQWDWIAESNRGASVTWTVSGLETASPAKVWQSKPITLLFSDAEVEGAIYYWSTGTAGVMKALVSDPIPVKFYTDPQAADADTCVACHTLSRDGKRLAVGYGGEKLRQASVPDRKTILPTSGQADRKMSWSTFSPDGKLLLIASDGKLILLDSDTGNPVGPNNGEVPLPSGKQANHPDWNALGDTVAVAMATKASGKSVSNGEIALIPYNGGNWGTVKVIVPSAGGDDNNFFPSWSPDSKWIAFVNAQGGSKDAKTAVLKLIAPSGGTPKALTRLNQRVNNQDGLIDLGNSMPTWAPSTKPGIFWLAYSSLREYATLRPADDKKDQIWIAAVDPAASDPGYSGFWAPFQSVEDGNHRAFWTHTDTDVQCLCVDICGDSLDNDCDGTADEADCVQSCGSKEICGNGKDDDCDCVVDECVVEICNNGIDDDGDGLIDENDPSCNVPK